MNGLNLTIEQAALISILKMLKRRKLVSDDDLKVLAMDFDTLQEIACEDKEKGRMMTMLLCTIADSDGMQRVMKELEPMFKDAEKNPH